jgi:hypothetical protein
VTAFAPIAMDAGGWTKEGCNKKIEVPIDAMVGIRALHRTLDDNQYHPHWCKPIALLILRVPRYMIIGDAANEGLGSDCVALEFMWRLDRANTEACAFRFADEAGPSEPADPDAIHITIL